jgi:hypothetical protein
LEKSSEEKKQNIPCKRLSNAEPFSASEIDHPFIFHKLAVRIEETLRSEGFRVAPVIGI